ncbi:TPA: hypothetical protein DEP30_03075 [Candidatus Nomurabacteria bacterium]|nr:MAG: hypothetical protein UR97_C0004G0124 [Candidatus Nomurabacteria bacterium GW2011_GWE2_36_115]KKP94255.1 MAG: hypothetical protein US00_C0003G0179 [Candidatus Nomurabacteria bacterium GW2011_GWF2_36_126]KKP96617.1 MAG: hypothetical protein US04_C0001G0119 [Candidatus Nomurabacteria bacterium GW2011_GWD2_36_14]KKP99779.1 MAG: hypothetical protein US08_C0001G0462 [Candidatus Nomurabacteria bacterium GW2011_GWF2_36_19]KKQ05275.1 MAG: hypothetical protein US17_C0005G0042 [Candidatus Nomuraba
MKKIKEEEKPSTEFHSFEENPKEGYNILKKIQKATEILAQKIKGHKRKRKYNKIKKQRSERNPPPSKK